MDIAYSPTQPGYDAWLADGNEGSFEDFLQDCASVSNKEHILEEIVKELEDMDMKELRELLEVIRDRNFIG